MLSLSSATGAALAAAAMLATITPAATAGVPGANGIIACHFQDDAPASSVVKLVDPLSRATRVLPSDRADPYDLEASWARDGQRLALARPPAPPASVFEPTDIVVTTYGSRTSLNVTQTPTIAEGEPEWSPDASRIAYTTSVEGNREIWTVRADGGDRRLVAAGEAPAWSPDGRHLAFARNGEIFTIELAQGAPRRVTWDNDVDDDPTWSPDGTRIAWSSDMGPRPSQIWTVPAGGGRAQPLTSGRNDDLEPAWSPDGRMIAFSRVDSSGFPALWTMTLEGGEERAMDVRCFDADWQRLNRRPKASIQVDRSAPRAGQTVRLRSVSSDPDGVIVRHSWDRNGDGRFGDAEGIGTSRTIRPGERTVTVRVQVTDVDGASATATRTLVVAP